MLQVMETAASAALGKRSRCDFTTRVLFHGRRLLHQSSSTPHYHPIGMLNRFLPNTQKDSMLPVSSCNILSQQSFSSSASPPKPTQPPNKANVVVVGGGIIGTSVAYHLGKLGVEDVVLLEQSRLTSGTTWHAAGLVNPFGSMSETSIRMRQYTKELYSTILPTETGDDDCGFRPVGFIELACDSDRLYAYRKVAAFNRYLGVDVEEISPR